MKKPLLAAAVLVVIGALVAIGLAWQRSAGLERLARETIPARPDLSNTHAELARRIESCEARQRGGADPVEALAELARLYHANGFLAEASECYSSLEIIEPGQPRWPHLHAHILAGYGEIGTATPLWERVVKLAPDYLPARLRLGDLWLKSGALDRAERLYGSVLERDPQEPYAQLGLARCDFERERWEAAREKLERVVRATEYQLGYDLIVTVYEKLGRADRAAEVRAMSRASGAFRDPADPWLEELLVDCFDPFQISLAAGVALRSGDRRTAIARLERALELDPANAPIRLQLAAIHSSAREYSKARPHLERATELSPDFADTWANLASLLFTVGQREAAMQTLERGLARCPDSPGLHLLRARRLAETGEKEAAIGEFRTAIRLRPNEADAYIELSLVLIGLNREAEAMKLFEEALVYEPGHTVLLTSLMLHAIRSGDEATARARWARIREQPRVQEQERATLRRHFQQAFGRPLD